MTQSRLRVVPCPNDKAKSIIEAWHRHHGSSVQARFSLAVIDEAGEVRGVAIVGRPVARFLDDGWTLEVNRVATDGTPNACSALYGASRRVAKELGYAKIITYIRADDEPGTSLRASGWIFEEATGPHTWNRPNRYRTEKTESVKRGRWSCLLAEPCEVAWPELPNDTLSLFDVEWSEGPKRKVRR